MSRWITVLNAGDLPPDRPVTVRMNNRDLALVRCAEGGDPHVVDNRCPHRGGQLGDGSVRGDDIVCPLHGYDFDLHSGISRYDPGEQIAVYPVRIQGGAIQVDADAVPALPAGHDDAYLARWVRRHDEREASFGTWQAMAGGADPVSAMRTAKPLRPSWDDVLVLPAQLSRRPVLAEEPVRLETRLGRRAARPLTLEVPFYISHMSFGALSASAKVALARASAALGTAIGSGEGGALPEERAAARAYIMEMASGYFGWTTDSLRLAHAVEIKIGQSAKAGSGGLLPGEKVTARIAEIRGLAPGEAAHSPARFPDLDSPADLRHRVQDIRDLSAGRPVGLKIAAGRVEEDLAIALEVGADFVTIDGRGGGTGAAPDVLKDNLTIPILYALDRARRFLAAEGAADLDLVATGGFRTAGDIVKAVALGARAVALATGAMIAIGCQQYLACHTGNCPVGIATQRDDLEARFDVDASAARAIAALQVLRQQIEALCRATGVADIHDLRVDDLATLDSEVAAHTAIRHA